MVKKITIISPCYNGETHLEAYNKRTFLTNLHSIFLLTMVLRITQKISLNLMKKNLKIKVGILFNAGKMVK